MLQTLRRPVSDPQLEAVDGPIKRKIRPPKPITIAVVSLLLAGGAALLRFGPFTANQQDLTPYVTSAERGVLSGLITASGELLAVQKVNVSPRQQGVLDQLLVDEGDAVEQLSLIHI